MTPVFCCGFECGALNPGPHWSNLSNGSISTSTVRSGLRSYRSNPSAQTQFAQATITGSGTSHVVRFAVYFATLPAEDTFIYRRGTAAYGGVFFQLSDGKLYAAVQNGSGLNLGSSGFTPSTGKWYIIDCHSATPATWTTDIKVDGVAFGQASMAVSNENSQLSNFGASGTWTDSTVSADIYYDDVLISITSGDYPLGDGFVAHFVPASDGTHNVAGAADFKRGAAGADITNSTTDAYLLVDEVPMDDTTPDTDDYINAIAPPNASDYVEVVFGPAPGVWRPISVPRAVDVAVAHHQAATQSGNIRLALNDNGTTDDVLNLTAAGVTTIRYARKHYATPPTGGSWTIVSGAGNFNNLRMRFYSSDAAPDQYFDCAMIEAEFPLRPAFGIVGVFQARKRAAFF